LSRYLPQNSIGIDWEVLKTIIESEKCGNGHREKDKRIRALTREIGFSPKVSDFQRLPTNKKANPKGLACEFGSMNI